MKKIMTFIRTTLLGGAIVILPAALMLFLLQWVFKWIVTAIRPITDVLIDQYNMPHFIAGVIAVSVILLLCFVVGILVKTKLGKWLYDSLESFFLHRMPGYLMIKDTVALFFNSKKSPFSSVALVRIYGNDTMMSAFVTDEHDNGIVTVFVPTGPNPTSGNIFHLSRDNVFPLKISVEDAMRSIIGCGAGSGKLMEAYQNAYGKGDG